MCPSTFLQEKKASDWSIGSLRLCSLGDVTTFFDTFRRKTVSIGGGPSSIQNHCQE